MADLVIRTVLVASCRLKKSCSDWKFALTPSARFDEMMQELQDKI
jgi:hypothetical protein